MDIYLEVYMVLYADILFLNNSLMTYALLWAVAQIADLNYRYYRLILGAVIGTIYTFFIIYFSSLNLPTISQLIIYLITNLSTALLMLFVSFGRLSIKKMLKTFSWLYLLTFLVVGLLTFLINFFSIYSPYLNQDNFSIFNYSILALIIIFILGRLGWRFFQARIKITNLILPVKIIIAEKKVEVAAFLDTGNKLNDPLNGYPVVIVELDSIKDILPQEIKVIIKQSKNKLELKELLSDINQSDWTKRIRILPFFDLQQDSRLLLGLKPDKLQLNYQNKKITKTRCVLGITEKKLDQQGEFTALIPPDLLY